MIPKDFRVRKFRWESSALADCPAITFTPIYVRHCTGIWPTDVVSPTKGCTTSRNVWEIKDHSSSDILTIFFRSESEIIDYIYCYRLFLLISHSANCEIPSIAYKPNIHNSSPVDSSSWATPMQSTFSLCFLHLHAKLSFSVSLSLLSWFLSFRHRES